MRRQCEALCALVETASRGSRELDPGIVVKLSDGIGELGDGESIPSIACRSHRRGKILRSVGPRVDDASNLRCREHRAVLEKPP